MEISNENMLLTLSEKNRELQVEFNRLVEEFSDGLWKYCRYLTGSPWDGEDLFQETMMKAFGGFHQRWHSTNPKSYLFRIATNTWIDHCRRERRNVGTLVEEDRLLNEETVDSLEIKEALGHLIEIFTPRQTAVFLLKEIFLFTAHEVAGMVHTTSGAIYATVRRMKERLKEEPLTKVKQVSKQEKAMTDPIIEAYLQALNHGNMEGVLALLSDSVHHEAVLGFQEFSKDEMRSGSMQFGLPGYRAEEFVLWDRPVIVVFYDGEEGSQVHDIQYQEVENGKIVFHRSFYFRKEFILAASKELCFSAQLDKPVVNWKNEMGE